MDHDWENEFQIDVAANIKYSDHVTTDLSVIGDRPFFSSSDATGTDPEFCIEFKCFLPQSIGIVHSKDGNRICSYLDFAFLKKA